MNKKRFVLVKYYERQDKFPLVVICDTTILIEAVVNGRKTRVYKPVSKVMDYLDAYPLMVQMNENK